ncbi:hypothetical protein GCM10020219_029580 [Nonomuraea dietziae]
MIAGAGPVGLATALLLARWRVPTVLLEAAAQRACPGSKAICFQRDVLDILDRVGVAGAMVAEGVTWTTGRTYFREHELYSVTFPEAEVPPWINISQARVEELLCARVAAEPLIDLRHGSPVIGYREDADGVDVLTPDGPVRGSHLVGADGPRSAVRRLADIAFPGRSFEDLFLICDIKASLPFPKERRFYFDPPWNPGRQVLVHQCPDSVWRIDWQVPPGFDPATADLDAMVRRITGSRPYEIVWLTVYRFHSRVATLARTRAGLPRGRRRAPVRPLRGARPELGAAGRGEPRLEAGPGTAGRARSAAGLLRCRAAGGGAGQPGGDGEDDGVPRAAEPAAVGVAAHGAGAGRRRSGGQEADRLGEAGRAVLVCRLPADHLHGPRAGGARRGAAAGAGGDLP